MGQIKEYFQHDYRAYEDLKMVACISEYGGEGYGFFWRIIEMLHQENEHKLPLKGYVYLAIAKQMLANAEQIEKFVKNCINEYELFRSDGDYFWSDRVFANIDKRNEISLKRSESGRLGAIAKQSSANAEQTKAKKKIKDTGKPVLKENNIPFDSFWKLYGKSDGKKKAIEAWDKLTDEERGSAISDVPSYLKTVKDKQFQKHASSYLNQKVWQDRQDDIQAEREKNDLSPEILRERKLRDSKYANEIFAFEYMAGKPIKFPDHISIYHVETGFAHELRK